MIMTLKQKIENLTWTDLIKKLKDILSNFSTKFDNLTGRVSTLESNSGSGGGIPIVPTLQEVTTVGNETNKDIYIKNNSDQIRTTLSSGFLQLSDGSNNMTILEDRIYSQNFNNYRNIINFTKTNNGQTTFLFPDISGFNTRTLAIREDNIVQDYTPTVTFSNLDTVTVNKCYVAKNNQYVTVQLGITATGVSTGTHVIVLSNLFNIVSTSSESMGHGVYQINTVSDFVVGSVIIQKDSNNANIYWNTTIAPTGATNLSLTYTYKTD